MLKLQSLHILWSSLSLRRRQQLLSMQLLSLVAGVGEVANLGSLLPFLTLLANPQKGISAIGLFVVPLQDLPTQYLLLTLGIGFMAVVVVSTILRVCAIRYQMRLASLIAADLGEQVFSAVLLRPFSWHVQQNSSSVLSHLTQDVDAVASIYKALLQIAVNLVVVLLLGASLIVLAPLAMIMIGVMLMSFYLMVYKFTRKSLRADGKLLTSNYQSSLQVAQEAIGGMRDVLLDQSQDFFLVAYRRHLLTYRLAGASINTKAQVPRFLIEGFSVLLIVGLSLGLAMGGQSIEQQIPLLGTLLLGAYRLLQPLQQCFSSISVIQASKSSLDRLRPFLYVQAEFDSNRRVPKLPPVAILIGKPAVTLESVSFRYTTDGPWVLRDIDLAVQVGERLAFVGSTGSGKSTCSDLILGLLTPTEGRVLVQGNDLQRTPGLVTQWQARVAHVPQQIYLSDASFAANIAFGVTSDRIDQERVRLAAAQACIAELIESSPNGYDTVVGERGVRLSGGQRQRIGIARALYRQAELLVLDEATSALDNRTEAEVMAAIEGLDRKITVILIAHRLSTVERCDRIVLLEQGQIRGMGSFHDLASGNASFQALAQPRDPLAPTMGFP